MTVPTEEISIAVPTLVLLGAGASVDAGFPSSNELHTELVRTLDPLYGKLAELVFLPTDPTDPERLFRILEFLHGVETEGRPADRRPIVEPLDVSRLVGTWVPDVASYLEDQASTVSGSPSGRVIDQLWSELRRIFSWSSHGVPPRDPSLEYLRHLVSEMRGQTIVTLNYDDALETAMASAGYMFLMHAAPYPNLTGATPNNPGQGLRLVKLHGSITWIRDGSSGKVRERYPFEPGDDTTGPPGVIFGAGYKLRPDGPYLALYVEFLEALSRARRVIVIGYSFRDEHVNEALRRWCEGTPSGSVFRIGQMTDDLPEVVRDWDLERRIDFQVIAGRAADRIHALLAAPPKLLSR